MSSLEPLAEAGELELDDPFLAANHFVGLLLWIPVNRAMFCGLDDTVGADELDGYADAAVRTFLRAYGADR